MLSFSLQCEGQSKDSASVLHGVPSLPQLILFQGFSQSLCDELMGSQGHGRFRTYGTVPVYRVRRAGFKRTGQTRQDRLSVYLFNRFPVLVLCAPLVGPG
jgi:hypothetical protein